MSDLLPGLFVLATGGSIAPPLLLLTILVLGSRRPLPNATALAIFVACVNLIAAAELSFRGSAVALGLVLVVFAIPVVVLIGLYAATPNRAPSMLGSLRAWIESNNRAITVVLGFAFGAFFLVRGLSG